MSQALQTVAVVVVVALVATPAMASPATVTIDATDSVQPGETVTVTLNVTNTGPNESEYLLDISVPDGWTVASHTDDGARWQASDTQWVWLSIDPGDSRHPSLELTVPSDTASGTATVSASVSDSESVRDTATVDVTVDDGGSGDDSSDSGGDDSSDDYDDGSGNDGGDSGDDVVYQAPTAEPTETDTSEPTATPVTIDGDGYTSSESDEATGTAGGPAAESTTTDASATETDNGTAASDTGNSSNSAVGIGLGALVLLAVGVGMVTARRDFGDGSIVDGAIAAVSGGSQNEPETTSSADTDTGDGSDGYGGVDIEVDSFQAAPDKCSLTYSTSSMGNKEIGDEIREIARAYASADKEEIRTQRLEATVCHDGQPIATWHIDSEWMDQFRHGDLSPEAFERRAVATLSFRN